MRYISTFQKCNTSPTLFTITQLACLRYIIYICIFVKRERNMNSFYYICNLIYLLESKLFYTFIFVYRCKSMMK